MKTNLEVTHLLLLNTLLATSISAESHSESWGYSMKKFNDEPAKINEFHREENRGYHGCIFSPTLCNDQEYCFDDQLFGRCTDLSEDPSQIETYQLQNEDRELIIDELQILEESGFGWHNQFTQCILNTLAYTIKSGSPFDKRECEVFLENMLVDEFPELNEAGPEYDYMEPADVIANTASPVDEVEEEIPMDFYSPESLIQESIVPKKLQFEDLEAPSHDITDEDTEEEEEEGDQRKLKFSDFANAIFQLRKSDDGHIVIYPNEKDLMHGYYPSVQGLPAYSWQPNEPEEDQDAAEIITSNVRKNKRSQNNVEDTFPSFNYIPDENINIQFPSIEGNDFLNAADPNEAEPYIVYEEPEIEESPGFDMPLQSIPVQSPGPRNMGEIPALTFGGLGSNLFDRKERLDVKKPGPFYRNSGNNFFLDKLINSDYEDHPKQQKSKVDKKNKNKTESATTDPNDIGQVEYEMPLLAPVKDKRYIILTEEIPEFSPSEDREKANTVHIKLGKRLDTMAQAEEMIKELADIFDISPQALSDHLIEENHVQFRVDPNPQNLGAKDIAERIDSDHLIKKRLDDQFGVNIDRARAGKTDDHFAVLFPDGPGVNMLVLAVVTASAIAALSVMLVMYILVKKSRNASLKMKKQHAADNERGKAQEEYQQLCRDWSRSSKKSDHSKNSPIGGRTNKTNGTTETRSSSTSSWSDDPNTTNMDISTGHMVLAYMEDHLKNKQRLEQEWVALCSYETDPSSTNVAFKAENKRKNRYPDKLPYDHNRVILNAMSSATNSDYINASTVTDSDPRNPSYIVTQGPLSNTVADFWQMIWEQGCVVIVMLTKLNENGQQLCHRYWPEEGSEQYHIFEVHLVSEHVWCDDYLVRSVYLKNTRTGETRTVTQFHFLSWPPSGVPAMTKSLLEFRRKVNKSYRGRSCPIAVHCSDGVGRAGTYILIDMVLNRMAKGCKEIDIAATLEHIRDQRGGMVSSRQQFEFCLMAVAEEVHAILKALPQ